MLSLESLQINAENIIEIIKDFIFKEVQKSGLEGAVVSVSGGIDSAVTLGLSTMALGSDKVFAVTMPERDITPKRDITDVMRLVSHFDVTCDTVDITPILSSLSKVLPLYDESRKIITGNLKPRVRMIIAYHYANEMSRMVVGSSNKTEWMTGYFTKYGDGGVDLMPLADLYKCQVRQIAQELGIPREIIRKTPSAGLWKGQSDEGEMGASYDTLDQVVHGYELGLNTVEIAEQLSVNQRLVEGILDRIHRNEHKRRLPLILRLTSITE